MSRKAFLVSFILLISCYPLLHFFEEKAEKEVFFNERLTSLNDIHTSDSFKDFTYNTNKYINENIFLKKDIIQNRSLFVYHSLNSTITPKILRTNEDWLFKVNLKYYSPAKLKQMKQYIDHRVATYFKVLKEYCERNGIEFHLVIAPSREYVHSEKTQSYIFEKSKLTPNGHKLFTDFMKRDDLNIINLFPIMEKYKNRKRLYNKYDIHWNGLGAFIGFEYMMAKINKTKFHLDIANLKLRKGSNLTGVFARDIGLQNILLDIDIEVDEPFEGQTITDNFYSDKEGYDIPKKHLPFRIVNPEKKKKVVFYHDSYGQQFSRFFGKHYQDTYLISPWYYSIAKNWNHCYLNPEVILREKPDVFIFQLILKRLLFNLESCIPYLESLKRKS